MHELNNNDMYLINGGAIDITGSWLQALAKVVTTIFDIARALGSSLRRNVSGEICPLS